MSRVLYQLSYLASVRNSSENGDCADVCYGLAPSTVWLRWAGFVRHADQSTTSGLDKLDPRAGSTRGGWQSYIEKPRALIMSRPSSVIFSGPHGGIQTQLMRN